MTRPAARIKHDEVVRLVKAAQNCGLSVSRISFNGDRVDVFIGETERINLDELAGPKLPEEVDHL